MSDSKDKSLEDLLNVYLEAFNSLSTKIIEHEKRIQAIEQKVND